MRIGLPQRAALVISIDSMCYEPMSLFCLCGMFSVGTPTSFSEFLRESESVLFRSRKRNPFLLFARKRNCSCLRHRYIENKPML